MDMPVVLVLGMIEVMITTVSPILKEMFTTTSGGKMRRNQRKIRCLKGLKVLVTHLEPHLGGGDPIDPSDLINMEISKFFKDGNVEMAKFGDGDN